MRQHAVLVGLLIFLFAPSRSAAQERFGQPGSIAISNPAGVSLAYGSDGRHSAISALLNPSGDYFFPKGMSVGGSLSLDWTEVTSPVSGHRTSSSFNFSAAPRIGYVLPLSARLSLWPQGSVRFWWTDGPSSNPGIDVAAAIPLVFEPATHFVVGFGPSIRHTFDEPFDGRDVYQLTTFLGGWF